MDLVTRVPQCPRVGETMLGKSFRTVPGGKGANQAVAAARLGAKTLFAGSVGDDAFGDALLDSMRGAGVDVEPVRRSVGIASGTAVIFVADTGQNMIVVTPGANHEVTPAFVAEIEPLIASVDGILMQLEIPIETVEAALETSRRVGTFSVFDAGLAVRVPESLLRNADLASPNEIEAEAMSGVAVTDVESGRRAAEALLDMGAREVVIKLGANGALHMDAAGWFHAPAFSVKAIDTVAAGDAFTAALCIGCCTGGDRREAVRFANATGALATTVEGAQGAMPTREAVEAFLREQA